MNQNDRDIRVLRELEQIFLKIEEYQSVIDKELSRIKHVENLISIKEEKRQELDQQFKETLSTLNQLENTLSSKEHELNQATSHASELTNQKQAEALQREVDVLQPEVDQLQEEILEKMEESESKQAEIKEVEEYLQNAPFTLEEIKEEVKEETKKEQDLIDDCLREKKELIEVLSDSGKELLLATENKFQGKNYFCHLSTLNCSRCGTLVDSEHRQMIEKQDTLVPCPGCRRLFLT